MEAKYDKCCVCGKQAVAYYPCIDPDIPSYPYCADHLEKAMIDTARYVWPDDKGMQLIAIRQAKKAVEKYRGGGMKFNIGDTIKLCRPFMRLGRNHMGMIGEVVDVRTYGRKNEPTHYVVKFEKYKIPHHYIICEIDESCCLVERK